MISKYEYNDVIYDTLEELPDLDVIRITGHKPLLENDIKIGNIFTYVDKTSQDLEEHQKQLELQEIRTIEEELREIQFKEYLGIPIVTQAAIIDDKKTRYIELINKHNL